MASIIEVSELRAQGGTTALTLGADGTVNMPTGITIGGADPFAQAGIKRGTRAERDVQTGETVRYNTDDGQLEHYFEANTLAPSEALWVPVGGRKLIAWVERSDNWSSVDIFWGPGTGANPVQYYNSYEIVMNFFEPGAANGEYYCRFIKADGNVDTATQYFHMGSGWHANDGQPRDASGTGGRSYFQITTLNNSYELLSNGESSWMTNLYVANTPSDATSNYWSFYYYGGGGTEQAGGEYHGGGCWRGASRFNNTGYPLSGIRIYSNVAARAVTGGCNLAVAVYATQPNIKDYPKAGAYMNVGA
ncbi:hypothetical protein R1080702_109 [Cyanophage S-RIM32]|uniref:Uncharacterized protein n=1 Tax=Cyanophage S-RIM32 TaxID=1278479 RepID=A0A127KMC9_9CAUD|nr:hypothetical protein BJD26_gp147 [Cyanophage S-RIM32]AMO43118.1 hypothetical protein R1080702_109 [Cyanophage S-RIM32]